MWLRGAALGATSYLLDRTRWLWLSAAAPLRRRPRRGCWALPAAHMRNAPYRRYRTAALQLRGGAAAAAAARPRPVLPYPINGSFVLKNETLGGPMSHV
jgi:hypothetical protein